MRFLAHAVPGLGPLLAEDLASTVVESDGRNDVVVFDGSPAFPRTAEDVFVQIAESRTTRGLVTAAGLQRALSVFASVVRPLKRSETFRVIARVKTESVRRTSFRDSLIAEVQHARPKWRFSDPAEIEIWAAQTGRNTWRSAIRLTRTRSRRTTEREGALRPSVAAAMVKLAGRSGRLLDPCCGAGTILDEARHAGWHAFGSDLDPDVAKRNGQGVARADATKLPFADDAFDAVVSNIPWGGKFERINTDDFLRVAPKAVLLTSDAKEGIDLTVLGRRVKLAVVTR